MRNTLLIAAVASGLALSGCTTDPNTGQQRLNKAASGWPGWCSRWRNYLKSNRRRQDWS